MIGLLGLNLAQKKKKRLVSTEISPEGLNTAQLQSSHSYCKQCFISKSLIFKYLITNMTKTVSYVTIPVFKNIAI